jgi:hypothetical protein
MSENLSTIGERERLFMLLLKILKYLRHFKLTQKQHVSELASFPYRRNVFKHYILNLFVTLRWRTQANLNINSCVHTANSRLLNVLLFLQNKLLCLRFVLITESMLNTCIFCCDLYITTITNDTRFWFFSPSPFVTIEEVKSRIDKNERHLPLLWCSTIWKLIVLVHHEIRLWRKRLQEQCKEQ